MQNREVETDCVKPYQISSISGNKTCKISRANLCNTTDSDPCQPSSTSTNDSRKTVLKKLRNFIMSLWHCICCLFYPRTQTVQENNDEECNHSQQIRPNRNETAPEEDTSPNLVNVQPINTISSWIDLHIFQKLDQTLITELSSFIRLQLPTTISIPPGATFLAYCSNIIHDRIIPILIPKGFYPNSHGQFTLNEEVNELHCPFCKQRISNNNPVGIGFRDCIATIKYRDTDGRADQFYLKSDMNTFAFAKFSQPGCVRYYFVKFNVDNIPTL